ncbi:MAG: xanthine dehydrogenase family protein molybdopterin-binding subunit, partial [Methyloceanibacter sp.]|nr:xanthine dehydrogenase family protein molybdopterin-binding subunit [Methyloceanibacter sp.]
LRISPDNTITVLSAHFEGGQGCHTGIATLVAEELDADWEQIRFEGAAGNTKHYGNLAWGGQVQGTGGSTAMASSWDRYRQAGAAARSMLIAAAAKSWGVPESEITIEQGVLRHHSGQSSGFGAFAAQAAKMAPPNKVTLKDPADWTHIGNADRRRPDTAPKTTGAHTFTIDVMLPDMLTAVLARPPLFGAKASTFDATTAKAVPGVVEVVETPRGVAVVGKDTWSAIKGRDALDVTWDDSEAEKLGSDEIVAQYLELAKSDDGAVVRNDGDAKESLADASHVVEAAFDFPYLAHAAMEPLNAVARLENGTLEIWAGHQLPDLYQQVAAQILGIKPERVKLHVMPAGGFFGRRATPDSDVIVEVASIVKALGEGVPVKVQWTREDDMTGGRYRPLYHHVVRAGLDASGQPAGWQHRIVGQSILKGTPFESMLVKDGIDATSVEGANDYPYGVPNVLVDLVTTDVRVPVLWWRAVGHTHTAYVVETVIDELAHKANKDPVEFRKALLQGHPRHLGVLNLAVENADWGTPMAAGRGRGVAVHKSFDSYVAQVAEVTVDDGRVKVERVVCAVDCGIAVNPDIIRAQMEGCIGYGLSAALHGSITLDEGRVVQTNFDGYRCLRIDEMPEVEVHIMPSSERPTGVGEPGLPPIAPAVANAVFAATGKRVRRLPVADQLSE